MQSNFVLAYISNNEIHQIRTLSDEELVDINSSKSILASFNRTFMLIEYVLTNYAAFKNNIEQSLHSFSTEGSAIPKYEIDQYIHTFNSSLLNLLTATRTFLDHMETNIKRTYGKNSREITLFKSLTSMEFDNNYSYRFMSKLRNYVQHCGMPPINISQSKTIFSDNLFFEMKFEFSRDSLLKNFSEWGAKLKLEIKDKDEQFDALQPIKEYILSMIAIYTDFIGFTILDEVHAARILLQNTIEAPSTYHIDEYFVLNNSKSSATADRINLKISWIPTSLFKKIDRFEQLKQEI